MILIQVTQTTWELMAQIFSVLLEATCQVVLVVESRLQFFSSEDHSYSSAKYESVPEPEEIIEISATDSPPIFCDDDVGEERRKAERVKQTFFIADEIDTLEVQVATEQDEDYEPDEASCSENGR